MNGKRILKLLSAPLAVGIISGLYYLSWRTFGLPTGEELVSQLTQLFELYGIWIVLVGALIEGVLLAGNYFPGGVIIFLGVVTAGDNIPLVIGVVAVVSLSFFIAFTVNYFLGRYGWYRLLVKFGLNHELTKAKARVEKHSFNAIVFSYWQPNLAALTSTAAGILSLPLKKFLWQSLVGILIWNIFWGTVVHLLGDQALDLVTNFKLVLPFLLGWIGILLLREFIKRRRKVKDSSL